MSKNRKIDYLLCRMNRKVVDHTCHQPVIVFLVPFPFPRALSHPLPPFPPPLTLILPPSHSPFISWPSLYQLKLSSSASTLPPSLLSLCSATHFNVSVLAPDSKVPTGKANRRGRRISAAEERERRGRKAEEEAEGPEGARDAEAEGGHWDTQSARDTKRLALPRQPPKVNLEG